jgi:hypothetical protein
VVPQVVCSGVVLIRAKLHMMLNTVQDVSKHYGIAAAQIRLWPCDPRENSTIRPDRPLQGESLSQTVQEMVSADVA